MKTTPTLFYFIGTTMAAFRRRRISSIPELKEQYRQRFFGDPMHICFGCSHTNPKSLKLNFFKTNQGGLAFKWQPEDGLESFPNIVHGGISGTLLDELGGVLIQAELDVFALTVSNRINYHSPVYRDRLVYGHAKVVAKFRKYVLVEGTLYDEKGKILSTMNGLYFIPSESMFKHVTKIKEMSNELASYVAK